MQEGGSFNCFCVFVSGFSIFRLLDKMLRHAKTLPQLGDSEELEKLIREAGELSIVESYYDQGNWCCIFEKIAPCI